MPLEIPDYIWVVRLVDEIYFRQGNVLYLPTMSRLEQDKTHLYGGQPTDIF